jgi:hypothetical protein
LITIYVKILNEDIDVFRPIKAIKLKNNVYQIIDENIAKHEKYGEIWEFDKDDKVICDKEGRVIKKYSQFG